MATYSEQILNILMVRPGLTHRELAQTIFGLDNPHNQRVMNQLIQLEKRSLIRKEGRGGNQDEHRYFLNEESMIRPQE